MEMDYFSYENNGANTNLVYTLKPTDEVDTVSFGMMNHNKIAGLVPMIFTQMDEEKYLKYNISSKVSMDQYWVGNISKERFLKCMLSIINTILLIEDYMMEPSSLLLEKEYIYINVSEGDAHLICLPLVKEDTLVDSKLFFRNIIFSTQFDPTDDCDYVAKVISYLNSASFSIEGFKQLVESALYGEASALAQRKEEKERVSIVAPQRAQPDNFQTAPTRQQGIQQGQQPMQQPVTQPQPVPPVMPATMQANYVPSAATRMQEKPEKAQKPKKEKRGLFGKKKAVPTEEGASIMSGMVIPGVTPQMEKATMGAPIPQSTVPPSRPIPQPIPQPMSQPVPQPVPQPMPHPISPSISQPVSQPMAKVNFGETTVLNHPSIGETTVLDGGGIVGSQVRPYLIRIKNNEKIMIDKPSYRIGKEHSYVDYFISDNTAISRSHASLITKGNEIYIVDTNSKNHTYVNGIMLQPNIEVILSHGAKIRLANEDFEFFTY